MTVKSRAVTVLNSATRLDTESETDSVSFSALSLYNNGSVTVYVGGSDVTTGIGVPVPAGTWGPSLADLDAGEAVYGVVASGTCEVRVLEAGV